MFKKYQDVCRCLGKKSRLVAGACGLALAGFSASATAQDSALEEITVTAQFKEQNLQDTPVAITAISGELLEARGQFSIEDIAAQAPNVTLTTGGGFAGNSLVAFIRGIGQTDFNPATEPGVGLYVDDIYYSNLSGAILDLMDLDRVEVLRGPQGTLAGKNSIGGSIKLFSKRPSADPDGYVEVGAGSLNALSVRGATNFQLADNLFARVSGVSKSRDGHVDILDWACMNPNNTLGFTIQNPGSGCVTGQEGGIDYTAARVALSWLASDTVEISTSVYKIDEDSEPPAGVLTAVGPALNPTGSPNGSYYPSLIPPVALGGPPPPLTDRPCSSGVVPCTIDPSVFITGQEYTTYASYGDAVTGSTHQRESVVDALGATLNINWGITSDLELQLISGYRDSENAWYGDQDASPYALADLYQRITHEAFSQEARLNGRFGDSFDYTIGAFYHDSETSLDGHINLGYAALNFIHGPDPVNAETLAFFANANWQVGERVALTAGLRYSEDEKVYQYFRSALDGGVEPGLASLDGVTSTFKDDRIDYRVALSFAVSDNTMVYGQVATGYKSGGANPRPFFASQASATVNPEELTSYEIGVKGQFFDNTLRLNGAVFFNDYTDVQFILSDCSSVPGVLPGEGAPCLMPYNAGNAETTGAELEIDFAPSDAFTIDASVSFIDFELQSVDAATGLTLANKPPLTPELTYSFGMQYIIDTDRGSFTPRLDVSHQDETYGDVANKPFGRMASRTIVNGRITWNDPQDEWQVVLEGKNLTDEYYFVNASDDAFPSGITGYAYGTPALPRTVNVIFKRNF